VKQSVETVKELEDHSNVDLLAAALLAMLYVHTIAFSHWRDGNSSLHTVLRPGVQLILTRFNLPWSPGDGYNVVH
jgi:hypothetical protein